MKNAIKVNYKGRNNAQYVVRDYATDYFLIFNDIWVEFIFKYYKNLLIFQNNIFQLNFTFI